MGNFAKITCWLLSVLIGIVTPIQAGQVITDAHRTWAKEAAEERAMNTVAAPNSLAVLYYRNMTGISQMVNLEMLIPVMIITDLVQSSLVQSGKVTVVERARLEAVLGELKLARTEVMSPQSAPQMGRMLAATYVAGGDIHKGQTTDLDISPLLVEVPNDLILDQPQVAGDTVDIIRIEKALLFDILEQMEVELTPEDFRELEKPLTPSLAVWEKFLEGIQHSDNGQYNQAAQSYRNALLEDPGFSPAQDALVELRDLGLMATESATALSGEAPPQPPEAPPPSGELGPIGNTALAAAGVVGGLALAILVPLAVVDSSDDNDDDNGEDNGESTSDDDGESTPSPSDGEQDEPDSEPDVAPTVTNTSPPTDEEIPCVEGQTFRFFFSEEMDPSRGQVSVTVDWDGPWEPDFITQWGGGYQSMDVVITDNLYCFRAPGNRTTIILSRFQDTTGNFLTGRRNFDFITEAAATP